MREFLRALMGAVVLAVAATPAPAAVASTSPRVVERVPPDYPAWARGSGVSTEVELRVRVGGDGALREVRVVPYSVKSDILTRQMRAAFDSAAVRAVRRWTFQPARRAGRAIAAWLDVAVPFEDPGEEETVVEKDPAINDRPGVDKLPEPRNRPAPEWPVVAPYFCKGMVVVSATVDTDGVIEAASILRSVDCSEPALAGAIDSAVVAAARQWTFSPAESVGARVPSRIAIPFRLPAGPAAGSTVLGCVRDSLTGHLQPLAEIMGRNGKVLGRADATGWFVLVGTAAEAREIRAHSFCYGGGLRPTRMWKRPGDEMTLYAWQNTCTDNPGR